MSKKIKAKKTKETDNYTHYDLEFNFDDIDKETLKTVCLDGGIKMVVGRNTKTDELQGLKILVPMDKDDKGSEEK